MFPDEDEWTPGETRSRRVGVIAATVAMCFAALALASSLTRSVAPRGWGRWLDALSEAAVTIAGISFVVMCVLLAFLYRRARSD